MLGPTDTSTASWDRITVPFRNDFLAIHGVTFMPGATVTITKSVLMHRVGMRQFRPDRASITVGAQC
jgi:hypothetical protein